MQAVNMKKGSLFYSMFQEFWRLLSLFINSGFGDQPDVYWSSVHDTASLYYKKYHNPYARELGILFGDFLDMRWKEYQKNGCLPNSQQYFLFMFQDFWRQLVLYINGDSDTDEYWEQAMNAASSLAKKYDNTPYSVKVGVLLMSLLELRWKEGQKKE